MQTRSNKSAARSKANQVVPQLERFKAMAEEVGADEAPGALDRSFGKIDTKRKTVSKLK